VPTSERPLRADAERNRRRVMDAARALFAERGLGVTLNDIARHAGVGVGTVYRRFPDKDALIDALFEERIEQLVGIARSGLEDPDALGGLVAALTRVLELQEADRGLKELMLSSRSRRERIGRIRARMAPVIGELVQRARASGQLRPEIVPQDFPLLQIMLGAIIDVARDDAPGLWRRYLELMVRGMRADPGPPSPLTVAPPAMDRMDSVLHRWQPPRRG
jgi:AcrR family transcriptional regulator